MLKPKCDKCEGTEFEIVDIEEGEFIKASEYFKPFDGIMLSNCYFNEPTKKAICKNCGAEYLH